MRSIHYRDFQYAENQLVDLSGHPFKSVMVFNDVPDVLSVRDWLNLQTGIDYSAYGHIVVDDRTVDKPAQHCVGICFAFDNDDDLSTFAFSCSNGNYIDPSFP